MTTQTNDSIVVKLAPAMGIFGATLIGSILFDAYTTVFFGAPDSVLALLKHLATKNSHIFSFALVSAVVLGATLHAVLTRLKRTNPASYVVGGALLAVVPAVLWSEFLMPAKQQSFGPTLDLAIVALGGAVVGALVAHLARRFTRDIVAGVAWAKQNPDKARKVRTIRAVALTVAATAVLAGVLAAKML